MCKPTDHVGEIKVTRGAKLGEESDGKGLKEAIRSNRHRQVQRQFILWTRDLFPPASVQPEQH